MERRGFFAALAGAIAASLGFGAEPEAKTFVVDTREAFQRIERRFHEHNLRLQKLPQGIAFSGKSAVIEVTDSGDVIFTDKHGAKLELVGDRITLTSHDGVTWTRREWSV